MTGIRPSANRTGNHLRPDRGIILVAVLWAVAMMSIIVVALSSFVQKSIVESGIEADRVRSEFALRSGLETAKAFIFSRTVQQQTLLDGTAFEMDIGGGRRVQLSILNAAGLVDINRASPKLIESLAIAAGLSTDQAAALAGRIVELRKQVSGEADQGEDAGVADRGAGQAAEDGTSAGARQAGEQPGEQDPAAKIKPVFLSPGQLRQLIENSGDTMDKLLPFVGLYSATGKVNPLAAPDQVLLSIPGIERNDIAVFAAARQSGQWENDAQLSAALEKYKDYLAVTEPNTFVIDVTLLRGDGIIPGRRIRAVVLLDETMPMPFRTLALSW